MHLMIFTLTSMTFTDFFEWYVNILSPTIVKNNNLNEF